MSSLTAGVDTSFTDFPRIEDLKRRGVGRDSFLAKTFNPQVRASTGMCAQVKLSGIKRLR